MELLTRAESGRLRELERVVEAGIRTFYEVGSALAEIRDGRLHRTTHETFEDYCRERWDMTRGRANQLIRAASAVEDLDTIVSKPKTESQARPLVGLPSDERTDAWEEAVETAPKGKVTAKHVEKVVNKKLGKPAPPAPATNGHAPTGKSLVNGVLSDDPPDIAKARAAGKIAPGVVPEVTEDDGQAEPAPEPPEPDEDDLDDETWLDALPLRARLGGACRKWFEIDALLYRTLEPARKTFQHHASRALKLARRRGGSHGEYAYWLGRFLKFDHPRHWKLCPKPEDGGCSGAGMTLVGECPRCHGRGYWV